MSVHDEVFEGPAVPMPSKSSEASLRGWSGSFTYTPGAAPPQPARHVAGYAPFLAFAEHNGANPATLSRDVLALLRFMQAHISALNNDDALHDAATVFLGNTIASMRTDAVWQAHGTDIAEVRAGRMSFVVGQMLATIESLPTTAPSTQEEGDVPPTIEGFAQMLHDWAAAEADDARDAAERAERMRKLAAHPAPPPAVSGAPRYERPTLPTVAFFGDDGQRVNYGERWGENGPAEDSYSRVSNPERFAGLHLVAHALIAHLEEAYRVTVRRERAAPDAANGGFEPPLRLSASTALEVVRVTPENPDAAPLTFAFTDYPGVVVEAGALQAFPYPLCGCDACDESAEGQVDELERLVFAVVNGGFSEEYPAGSHREAFYSLVTFDAEGNKASSSGNGAGYPTTMTAAQQKQAAATLAALPHGWQPWPRRAVATHQQSQ